MSLLEIKNLHVEVEDKKILNGLTLSVEKGQVAAIMGRGAETATGWEAGPVPVTISGAPGLLTELTARHSFLRYRVWCPPPDPR